MPLYVWFLTSLAATISFEIKSKIAADVGGTRRHFEFLLKNFFQAHEGELGIDFVLSEDVLIQLISMEQGIEREHPFCDLSFRCEVDKLIIAPVKATILSPELALEFQLNGIEVHEEQLECCQINSNGCSAVNIVGSCNKCDGQSGIV